MRALGRDTPLVAGVLATEDLVDEVPVGRKVSEVGAPAQEQRIADRALEVSMRALDRAVLVCDTAVVAARLHPVVQAQGLIARGQILPGGAVQVMERCREAVAAMLARRTAERPQSVLQPLGQGHVTLPTHDHVRVLEARTGEPEVIQPVLEGNPGHTDREVAHLGEVRESHLPGLMYLAEDNLVLRPVQCPPSADAPLERAPDALIETRMASLHLLEHRHGAQLRRRQQHWHDLGVEELHERIGSSSAPGRLLLGRQPWIAVDPVGARNAD